MKKNLIKKLSLKKQTIVSLTDSEKKDLLGGAGGGVRTKVTCGGCPSEWPCGSDYPGCIKK